MTLENEYLELFDLTYLTFFSKYPAPYYLNSYLCLKINHRS